MSNALFTVPSNPVQAHAALAPAHNALLSLWALTADPAPPVEPAFAEPLPRNLAQKHAPIAGSSPPRVLPSPPRRMRPVLKPISPHWPQSRQLHLRRPVTQATPPPPRWMPHCWPAQLRCSNGRGSPAHRLAQPAGRE
ncbi:MAG: hypothetical protein IPK16_30045 [Anaerolineales bacterium]|nr:hypothetical protein [Anaerolineales bacterium]